MQNEFMGELWKATRVDKTLYIQMHNNPDADAIASAKLMQMYIKDICSINSEIIYYGTPITKPNLLKLCQAFNIELINNPVLLHVSNLLMVDCCFGNSNVKKIEADSLFIIDHHIINKDELPGNLRGYVIDKEYQSCATLIFQTFIRDICKDIPKKNLTDICSIIYYGLYTDTNSLSELSSVGDRDIQDYLLDNNLIDKHKLNKFLYSNISLEDLINIETSLTNIRLSDDLGRYAIIRCKSKDDNVLGYLSSMLLELNGVDIVVVYSRREDGYKLSIRSCDRYLTAKKVVDIITERVGTGGGHLTKSGGFILYDKLKQVHTGSIETYIYDKLRTFEQSMYVIESGITEYQEYIKLPIRYARKNNYTVRYLNLDECANGRKIHGKCTVRTKEGPIDIDPIGTILIVGPTGEVYPVDSQYFNLKYVPIESNKASCDKYLETGFAPKILSLDKPIFSFNEYKTLPVAKPYANEIKQIILLDKPAVIFTKWDKLNPIYGSVGDYLVINSKDDYYVIDKELFNIAYSNMHQ